MKTPNIDLVNISTLFAGEEKFVIPIYQRDYKWEVNEAKQFLDDYLEFAASFVDEEEMLDSENQIHYLGPIYLAKAKDEKNRPYFDIVDGQQRLTTLSLLVAGIKKSFYEILEDSEKYLNVESKVQLARQMAKLDQMIYIDQSKVEKIGSRWTHSTSDNLRMNVKKQDAASFFEAVNSGKIGLKTKHDKTIRYFKDTFKSLYYDHENGGNLKKWFDSYVKPIFSKIKVLKVEIVDINDAYSTFERLNDRGVRLTVFELINNKMLSRFREDEKQQKKYSDLSDRIVYLCRENGLKPSKVLLNHFQIKYRKISEKEIPSEYSKKLVDFDQVVEEFEEIIRTLGKYKDIFTSNEEFSGENNAVERYKILSTPYFRYSIAFFKQMNFNDLSVEKYINEATSVSWNANINNTSLGALYNSEMNSFMQSVENNSDEIIINDRNNHMNSEIVNKTISNEALIKYAVFIAELMENKYTPKEVSESEITFFANKEKRISNIKEIKIAGKLIPFDLNAYISNIPNISKYFD